jgi:hypothetical protein
MLLASKPFWLYYAITINSAWLWKAYNCTCRLHRCGSALSQVALLVHGYTIWQHACQGYATIGSIALRLCVSEPLQTMSSHGELWQLPERIAIGGWPYTSAQIVITRMLLQVIEL